MRDGAPDGTQLIEWRIGERCGNLIRVGRDQFLARTLDSSGVYDLSLADFAEVARQYREQREAAGRRRKRDAG